MSQHDEQGTTDERAHPVVRAGKPTRWTQRLWVAAMLAGLTAIQLRSEADGTVAAAWTVTLATTLAATATWWLGKPRERSAVVEHDRVGIDGIGWVARRDVREISHQVTREGRALMVLRGARGEALASLDASDGASGERVLGSLGLRIDDVARRVGSAFASRPEQLATGALVVGCALSAAWIVDRPGAMWPGVCSLGVLIAAAAMRRQVLVGLDAVVIERLLHRKVYPYSRIARLDRGHPNGPALVLDDGSIVPLTDRRGPSADTAWAVGWIEHALARWREREAQQAPAGLAPGDADVEAWKRRLDGLSTTRDYRTAHVPPTTLLRIAVDPSASAEERVGAARVLCRVQLEDAEREHLERAAVVTAEPSVRCALEASARADLAGTEKAMRTVRTR